jgi:hypothetical protein
MYLFVQLRQGNEQMSEAVTAYKSKGGLLFDTADKALDHDVYKEVVRSYFFYNALSLGPSDMRSLYKLLKGFYDE